ncbi:hypothetical protein AUEXF2481DRAFT_699085 [Aureobasidium subglaciale EXF-2481]|uniref:Uncharacterized protein n=1 Tax=Aureobasidium subglaciale (strain EXF-2481) TaxID=1043005 RepID=A0A074YBI5_AURSE|nr:uncharacterized protein AUEXF2481DRAFT_699085 [Aureobasidium subglaciale EXF-2481]KAI5199636.1 hypothetical protein E4T38_06923 [Aureobasidium subglaciale]KAI5218544.1 hypothetical protein E4T40_06854 [Aureobasidium subglaciale]KAI5222139.1 hypothetical protein E4T41_06774 [Aureobasidium subglaciale]KAI5259663.1 hypothetical protein E4T46_06752 [Aureobasidium subglaciale]KEQ93394.1 hypothetical protein AUEXF2481DRAFT_699085 [Aureobasidium subglaciale EXF-2481]
MHFKKDLLGLHIPYFATTSVVSTGCHCRLKVIERGDKENCDINCTHKLSTLSTELLFNLPQHIKTRALPSSQAQQQQHGPAPTSSSSLPGHDPEVVRQVRDVLYKHVFDHATRRKHWVERQAQGRGTPGDLEPLTKQQKSQERYQKYLEDKKWVAENTNGNPERTIDPAFTAEGIGVGSAEYASRLLLDLEVTKEGDQRKAEEDVDME